MPAHSAHLAVLRADADERGAQAVVGRVPQAQQPLVQQQRAAPGRAAPAQRAHQLVQLAVVLLAGGHLRARPRLRLSLPSLVTGCNLHVGRVTGLHS